MSSNKLEGLSFYIIGDLKQFKNRYQAEELILKHGGVYERSVGKRLSYLVTNNTERTTQHTVAENQKGTDIITEQQLLDMIDG